MDPLTAPHHYDSRPRTGKGDEKKETSEAYFPPYEPLPRSGIAHPFVQAILSPWLGPDADLNDINHGLTTLRTWWQHRRKGESISAKSALGVEKMKGVVEGYTRHFFNLAHCMIMYDKETPPRTLSGKMQYLNYSADGNAENKKEEGIVPKETKKESTGILEKNDISQASSVTANDEMIEKNEEASKEKVVQRARRITNNNYDTDMIESKYDDTDRIPIVCISQFDEVQIAFKVTGMTCTHCVRVIEKVIKGIHGLKSPIPGVIDAVADFTSSVLLILISEAARAKCIAHEVSEILGFVGFTANVLDMKISDVSAKLKAEDNDHAESDKSKVTDHGMNKIFKTINMAFHCHPATPHPPLRIFNWDHICICPDNGVLEGQCNL